MMQPSVFSDCFLVTHLQLWHTISVVTSSDRVHYWLTCHLMNHVTTMLFSQNIGLDVATIGLDVHETLHEHLVKFKNI